MSRTVPLLAVLLLAVLLPASAAAQGLGDTAAREQKKREEKKAAAPARVFTNQDLPAPAAPSDPSASGEPTPGATGPEESAGTLPTEGAATVKPGTGGVDPAPDAALETERQERKLLEAEWRVRFANAREQVAVTEAACWQEVVRTQFYNGIPVQMKVKEFVESEEHRRAKAALADLEEEFRRTGLPPGWAREQ
jgi:hypothetical protein